MAGSVTGTGGANEFRGARNRLVETLRARGISDLAVLRAFEMTPRHLFVPTGLWHKAYEDAPLPIGSKQTISQPSIHAKYLELIQLTGQERVLEIGTGSGYQTVLLAHLVEQVFSIERIAPLLDQARANIQRAGVTNVSLLLGDGTVGWRAHAPYDAILVSAASPKVPQPLVDQLAEGGKLVIPLGGMEEQELVMFTRRGLELKRQSILPVRFVPLLGMHGWKEGSGAAE
ncbi:MAG TPA: protein-L-isoaspartate(D-aspartate) O-methyltransferase [Gemmatimonadaceae bacterium]|nr:protein-L-isoaspartate(D-aspartate) O-methyltransferase [Gemmatimonadaceae bacterium]